MKILYGIQGTGNGHISRARTFLPLLRNIADVDVLLSGRSSEVSLDEPIAYRVHGLGYTFGRNGGIDFLDSARKLRPVRLMRDIRDLPVRQYDLVISDFEPVSARAARRAGKMCIGLSHQAAFMSPKSPRPGRRSLIGEWILRSYAPCSHYIGFHYREYDDSIFTPVIGKDIRALRNDVITPGNMSRKRPHVTVYLPSHDERTLMKHFEPVMDIDWHIFSKTARTPWRQGHIRVHPVDVEAYTQSLAGCIGLICGAGFETPSEALYLGKPLLAIPMKWQYEQQCNASALRQLGVTVCPSVGSRFKTDILRWLEEANSVHIPYTDNTSAVISRIRNLYELNEAGIRFPVQIKPVQLHEKRIIP